MKLVDRKQGDSRIILIVKELAKRIRHHAQGSGLLDGVTFRKTPIALVEGVDQLPAITMMEYTDVDNYFDGAKTGLKKSTNVIRCEAEISFLLSFNKDHSFFSENGQKPWGYIDWVERFKDAIETDEESQVDLTLGGTCIEPLVCHVREGEISDVTWNILFEVEVFPKPIQRGTRTYNWSS